MNCASCGLPRPDARHITDLPDLLLPKGHCGAALHPAWSDQCASREVLNLRSQLSAATARASELERELADANAMIGVQRVDLSALRRTRAGELNAEADMGERVARLEEIAKVATELLALEDDQDSWSDGTWDDKREELEMRLGLIAPEGKGETNG